MNNNHRFYQQTLIVIGER